ncbi:hypothetical protein [Tateyamaria sp. SN6-1]|uniref:hypothetical protein n=1 Tax=Tateyamaria sp. SN6-1 TaxID=3092148 RepID=UPI0039F61ED7
MFDHITHRTVLLRIHKDAPPGAEEHLKAAVAMIAETDAFSLSHLPTYLPDGIAAEATSCADARHTHPTRTCFIAARTLVAGDINYIACCILHKMCHARLMARGIGYDEDLRVRVEKVCTRRELAFARKRAAMGHAMETTIADAQAYHDSIAPQHVSTQHFHSSYRKQVLERLRRLKAHDIPRWIHRLIILRARRKLADHRAASQARQTPSASVKASGITQRPTT